MRKLLTPFINLALCLGSLVLMFLLAISFDDYDYARNA
jgi:hypothetical protein